MTVSPPARTSAMLFPPAQQLSVATIALAVTLVYFMWMDVALYINLQQMQPLPPPQDSNSNNNNSQSNATPPARMGPSGSFSPVYPVHVKQLMQGPVSHYVLNSLGHWIVTYTDVAVYLTADAVSSIGLFFALISGRLITSDSLRARQLGVLFWQLRDLMDDMDGWVARKRNSALGFTIQTTSWGYYKDGIFDGIGIIFFLMGKKHTSLRQYF